MVNINDYGSFETAWCPGCGNFPILNAVKKALVALELAPHQVLFVSGIGQAAKAPHYLNANLFNGLHGRGLPVATGAKLANHKLTVIAESGDGCVYGEGGNHFLSAIRRNIDITLIVHNNQVYGLTKGQASPTSDEGFVTKAQPHGVYEEAFNPISVAVAMHASFVARSFSGLTEHLARTIVEAVRHKGFSIVDVLQPCITFNKINNFAWYKKRCYELPADYNPENWKAAMKKASEWGEKIPIGVIYKNNRLPLEEKLGLTKGEAVFSRVRNQAQVEEIMKKYF
ncbi:MAG: 2-oxoacid ferredoxin oxidoreductase [Deltaproteobacteria bacterium]|nr:2-oxoacid ferredoxin oxidoreductase [Deltaproteobacteria bacterium]